MKRLIALGALLLLTACTPSQVQAWLAWHDQDPVAAETWLNSPEGQDAVHGRSGTDGPQFAESQVVPGDCDSYVGLFNAYGLPAATFKRIAWRESGCDHTSWVNNRTDLGGGLLGINFRTQQLRNGWMDWCGAAPNEDFRYNPDFQVRCAAEAYQRLGLRPWS